ncbi:hypothetical protein [Yersinia aleksiciae]|uniref:hypothetical protein n=1 Tax=Yersinia aleksiciae TaxID=263819 RepID=UPI001427E992|nr:hypothetical protein [Yersinia aleksiciae]MDA5499962.1 hypothetical protein [Yersinia aleksiciae]NIL01318.1 hypothetical protein [Yersinia aleksiciae]WQC69805.1 hypothetical protein N0K21_14150 [Yersinia aleksiciae]
MSNVVEFHAARLDAIESAINRLAIAISETGGPKAKELDGSVNYFRDKLNNDDLSAFDKDVCVRIIRLLDPLGCDPIKPY